MRNIKELLTVVRDGIEKDCRFYNGICSFILEFRYNGSITKEEYAIISDYIRQNIPLTKGVVLRRISRWRFTKPIRCFWWKQGKKEPRIKWLNKQINKLT